MSSTASPNGTTTHFEVLVHDGEAWQPLERWPDLTPAQQRMNSEVQGLHPAGARVDRCVVYAIDGFVDRLVVDVRLGESTFDRTLGNRGPESHAPPDCSRAADFYSAPARRHMHILLAKHLRRRRRTPLDILHSGEEIRRLSDSGDVLAALQRVGIAQARRAKQTPNDRIRELSNLTSQVEAQMHKAGAMPPPVADAAAFVALARDAWASASSPAEADFAVFRPLVAALAAIPDWRERLSALDRRADMPGRDPEGEAQVLRYIDAYAAELVVCEGALAAIFGPLDNEQATGERVGKLLDLLSGEDPGRIHLSKQPIDRLVAHLRAGRLPRLAFTLRQLLVQAIIAPGRVSGKLNPVADLKGLAQIRERIHATGGLVAEDRDMDSALVRKANTILTPEALESLLEPINDGPNRVLALLELAAMVPEWAAHNREAIADRLTMALDRSSLTERLELRAMQPNFGKVGQSGAKPAGAARNWRVRGILVLAQLSTPLRAAPFDRKQTAAMWKRIDAVMVDLLREELAQQGGYVDRMMVLLRVAAGSPKMPPGKLRQLVQGQLEPALANKDLMMKCFSKISDVDQRKQMLAQVRAFIAAGAGR